MSSLATRAEHSAEESGLARNPVPDLGGDSRHRRGCAAPIRPCQDLVADVAPRSTSGTAASTCTFQQGGTAQLAGRAGRHQAGHGNRGPELFHTFHELALAFGGC